MSKSSKSRKETIERVPRTTIATEFKLIPMRQLFILPLVVLLLSSCSENPLRVCYETKDFAPAEKQPKGDGVSTKSWAWMIKKVERVCFVRGTTLIEYYSKEGELGILGFEKPRFPTIRFKGFHP